MFNDTWSLHTKEIHFYNYRLITFIGETVQWQAMKTQGILCIKEHSEVPVDSNDKITHTLEVGTHNDIQPMD
jgi:hypothetical protein